MYYYNTKNLFYSVLPTTKNVLLTLTISYYLNLAEK